jgi:hypothetical protein
MGCSGATKMVEQRVANTARTEYEAPRLAEIGTFEEITQGGQTGGFTDRFFPAGTPKGDITFS